MEHTLEQCPAVQPFWVQGFITGVRGVVKSGKEATVYCCDAHPSTGAEFLAAKVYRPLGRRAFRNDAIYQEGRVILDARMRRAYRRKTRTGRGVQFGTWVQREFDVLKVLHAAGAHVPQPVAQSGGAILMEYVGDGDGPAPMLRQVRLDRKDGTDLLEAILLDVELFLTHDCVHADLSAFNVLYHRGTFRIIDFPQSVDPRFNPNAFSLLTRDLENVCRHFARYGVKASGHRLAGDLWTRYVHGEV